MNRKTIAIVVGIIIGGLFVALGEQFVMNLFPAAKPAPTDPALWGEYLKNDVSFISKLLVILNWGFASFIAGLISTLIAGRRTISPMLASVGVLNIMAIINMMMHPHPTWMWVSAFLAFIPVGLIAYFLIRKKKDEQIPQ